MSGSSRRSRKNSQATSSQSPFHIDLVLLLGEPALLEHEDQDAYVVLEKRLIERVQPKDAIELIFIRDVADLTFDIQRLKLARSHLIENYLHEGLVPFISKELKGDIQAFLASLKWRDGEPVVSRKIKRLLEAKNVTCEMIVSATIRHLFPEYEGFSTAIARLEARRNAILDEIDRHRQMLAYLLKEEIHKLEVTKSQSLVSQEARSDAP